MLGSDYFPYLILSGLINRGDRAVVNFDFDLKGLFGYIPGERTAGLQCTSFRTG